VLFLPEQQYRLQLLTRGFGLWRQSAVDTQHMVAGFQRRWQRQRLLQKALLLWHALVLLLQQQQH
jgi:hypothetical protein